MGHVALYCRLSPRPDGRSEGVDVQERQGRDYAATAWPGVPVVIYADRLLSAADEDVWRPEYEKLRQAVRDGQVAHIWCVEQSRLQRLEVGWFVLAAELVTAGIDEVHTARDGVVRVGDEIAGIKAVLAAGEVRKLKRRVNDRLDDNAAQGLPPGSVPFGLRHGVNDAGVKTYVHVRQEADAIRWAAGRVLAGWSLSSVAAGLRDRGLHGPHLVKVKDAHGVMVTDEQGNPVTRLSKLTAASVRNMLTSPTVAGKRVHRGEIVGDGNWEPILDEATWQACKARLSGSRKVTRRPNPDGSGPATYPVGPSHTGYSGRKYALTGGLAVCGVCEAPLVGSLKQMRHGNVVVRTVPYLLCNAKVKGERVGKGCIGIMLAETEEFVIDRLFAELDKPGFLDAIAEDVHAARREEIITALAAIDGKRNELTGMWTADLLTSGEWTTGKAGLDRRELELRTELGEKGPPPARVDIEQARRAWPGMTLGEQREFIRLFIDLVTVNPAKPGTKGFDSGRVVITWREAR